MIAAKLATLGKGTNQHASIEAPSQSIAAAQLNVSRSAVQRARQVLERGAPELVAANLRRRHLTPSQLAVLADELAQLRHGGFRGNQYTGGKAQTCALTQNEAADLVGASRRNTCTLHNPPTKRIVS